MKEKVRINNQIKARELRVIDEEKGNLGVISTEEALRLAKERNLDLIEISPDADPPIAKITDYGKFQYNAQKKEREAKVKAHVTETPDMFQCLSLWVVNVKTLNQPPNLPLHSLLNLPTSLPPLGLHP